jgi:glycerol-3-phosphate acyltransferase PlsY
MLNFIFPILCGYLLGSIPFGLVLCRIAGYGDIRNIGSGNIGATNVLRTGNKLLALLTLILDISKGLIAVLIVRFFTQDDTLAALAGLTAIIGHNFPLWLQFKGGKGVATSLGTITAIHPITGISMAGAWLCSCAITRISSFSAMMAFVVGPLVSAYFLPPFMTAIIYCICLLGVVRHHANITRLLAGEEPQIKLKKS